jgi:WD40 repeat protein
VARRAEAGRLAAHAGNVTALVFRPDGLLVTGGADAAVKVWDVGRREAVRTLTGHTAGVLAVAASADGRWLASGGEDNTVRLWDAATGAAGPVLRGHGQWVLGLAFCPDGTRLVSGSRDRTARLWDVASPKAPPVVVGGFTNWVYAVGFAPDGRTLMAASGHYSIDSPGELKLCDPVSGYVRATLGDFRAPAAFAGGRLLAGCRGGVAELVGE